MTWKDLNDMQVWFYFHLQKDGSVKYVDVDRAEKDWLPPAPKELGVDVKLMEKCAEENVKQDEESGMKFILWIGAMTKYLDTERVRLT